MLVMTLQTVHTQIRPDNFVGPPAQIQKILSGVQAHLTEKSSENVIFFSPQLILQFYRGGLMVSKVREGVQHFPGWGGGGPNANFCRNL